MQYNPVELMRTSNACGHDSQLLNENEVIGNYMPHCTNASFWLCDTR